MNGLNHFHYVAKEEKALKALHYNIEEYVLTNAGYKYNAAINDLK